MQPPHGLTGPPLPHLIQGLQCHSQGGILQHGRGPCNRQLLPSMRPLGSWWQARCHCRILPPGRKASLPDGPRPPGNRACYLDKVGARESVQERKHGRPETSPRKGLFIRSALGWRLGAWISGGFPPLWYEGLTVPELYKQVFMVNTPFPLQVWHAGTYQTQAAFVSPAERHKQG